MTISSPPAASAHGIGKYRPDIDGLRAVAVMLVVLNHLQFRHFEGGYVGVDVFFVISGYLIGASLINDFRQGCFSLTAFYERRIRRIFPVLLALLLVVSIVAYHYTMPDELVSYAGSLLAALFSFSNFYFWHQAGYFDAPSAAKPLLHTWSLAVEEQFYVFFPLLLYAVFRWFPRHLKTTLWFLAAVTLALSAWVVRKDSPTAFFWSPLRAWELIGGVLVSQYAFVSLRQRWAREACAFLGLVFILISGLRYTPQTLFPGLSALLPCAGTILLIAAGQVGNSGVGILLSTPPFRFIGLISYSLYLWHWPIHVFQNSDLMVTSRPAWERSTKNLLLAFSLVIAALSWRFIETPFRQGRFRPTRRALFSVIGAVALLIFFFGAALLYNRGLPSRFPADVLRVSQFSSYKPEATWRTGSCFINPPQRFTEFQTSTCLDTEPGKKTYLLYGDSTGAQLYPGLVKAFPEIHFQQATVAACQPSPDAPETGSPYAANCSDLWRFVQQNWLSNHHPDAVVLAALWGIGNLPALEKEIRSLQDLGIPVVLLGPVLNFDLPLPVILGTEMRRQESEDARSVNVTRHLYPDGAILDKIMQKNAQEKWHVRYISYFQNLCGHQIEDVAKVQWETTTGCPLFTPSGDPLLFDEHHFTLSGSLFFAAQLRAQHELP